MNPKMLLFLRSHFPAGLSTILHAIGILQCHFHQQIKESSIDGTKNSLHGLRLTPFKINK